MTASLRACFMQKHSIVTIFQFYHTSHGEVLYGNRRPSASGPGYVIVLYSGPRVDYIDASTGFDSGIDQLMRHRPPYDGP